MKVKSIIVDWFFSDQDNAEGLVKYEVGENGVSEIIENEPRNGLQKWNYLITKEDGTKIREFNINTVEYFY